MEPGSSALQADSFTIWAKQLAWGRMNSLLVRSTPAWEMLGPLQRPHLVLGLRGPPCAEIRESYCLPVCPLPHHSEICPSTNLLSFAFYHHPPHQSWPYFPFSLLSHFLDDVSTQMLAPRDSVLGRDWTMTWNIPTLSIFSGEAWVCGFLRPGLKFKDFPLPNPTLPFWGGSCLTHIQDLAIFSFSSGAFLGTRQKASELTISRRPQHILASSHMWIYS